MSLVKSYLSVLEEKDGSSIVSGTEKLVGDLPGKTKEHVPANKVEGVETPVEGAHSQQDSESEPKEVKTESAEAPSNPFDELYKKVLAEESWEYETEAEENPMEMDLEVPSTDTEVDMDFTATDSEGSEEEEMEEEPEGLEAVLDHLKQAVSALEKLVDEADEDEDMEEEGMDMMKEEEDEMEEEMSDETLPEAVEAEVEGHALVDQEKLAKGLNKPTSATVKGAVPVTKGKAQVVKGAKVDGKPAPCMAKPDALTNKSASNVGGVKPGKDLFAQ